MKKSVGNEDERDKVITYLEEKFREPEIEYWPEVRWWLAEGMNTDKTLEKNISDIYKLGFGAAEFLAMPEPGADSSVYGWGSKEWTNDSRLIIRKATELGMGFSLTSGANWSNANLPDTYVWKGKPYNPDNKAASKELDYATILLKAGETYAGLLPYPIKLDYDYTEHIFYGVVKAKIIKPREKCGQEYDYAEGEGTGVLEFDSLEDITSIVEKREEGYYLEWKAPKDGTYALFIYWMHGTGQTASPSVSVNYTVNYMDTYGIEALIDYWEEVILDDEIKEVIRKNGRGQFYMDSMELSTYGAGGMFWGYNLKDEFMKRMEYDITPYLPLLTIDGHRHEGNFHPEYKVRMDYTVEDDTKIKEVIKVHSDLYSVMTDMYLENVLKPLQEWLKTLNMTLRAEPSYGMTFEISKPAKYLDGVETESFAQAADIELYRGMSGSANMYGRLFSSETGAVEGKNYYYNMEQWTQLCYLQFAEGVNRTVLHGYSGIEGCVQDTYWPGHEGMYAMFSERFGGRQPAAKDYKDWTTMLARNQKILRQGNPVRDLAILRTDYFFAAYDKYHKNDLDLFPSNYMMNDKTYFWNDLSLQQEGYTWDYFSPLLLEDEENVRWTKKELQPDGPAYRALIIYQEMMEISSANKLYEIAKDGLPVIFVNNNLETVRHGKEIKHGKAASRSRNFHIEDGQIQEIIKKIKKLPNVKEADCPEDVKKLLHSMNIYPRIQYTIPNNKILAVSRKDKENQLFYTFLYSYKFEKEKSPYTFEVSAEGEGDVYSIDDWTGEIEKSGIYKRENGRTYIKVTLQPGEARILVFSFKGEERLHAISTTADKVIEKEDGLYFLAKQDGEYLTSLSNGEEEQNKVSVPEAISLETWDIVVEDWNEGERIVNKEEKFGHITEEVYFKTKKTALAFKESSLKAWKDLPANLEQLQSLGYENPSMEHVSGIGTYTAEFEVPSEWSDGIGAYLCIDSAGGGTVAVYINGQKIPALNIRTLKQDITNFIHPGQVHKIKIEVASTLTNRMIQRKYPGWISGNPQIQNYGLVGQVKIVPFVLTKL